MNYCAAFAESALIVFTGFVVYSNVDPAREWNGSTTIEFNEPEDPTTKAFLSGREMVEREIYGIVRAKTYVEASDVSLVLRRFCEEAAGKLEADGQIYAWSIEECGTTADSRGVVEGESFYGYVKVNLIERI